MILCSEGFGDAGLAAFRRLANGLDQRQGATGIGSADQRLNLATGDLDEMQQLAVQRLACVEVLLHLLQRLVPASTRLAVMPALELRNAQAPQVPASR